MTARKWQHLLRGNGTHQVDTVVVLNNDEITPDIYEGPWLGLAPDPLKAVGTSRRDISHVLRDERGRWIDTPGVGDDAVVPSELPERTAEQIMTPEQARAEIAIIDAEYTPVIDRLNLEKAKFHAEQIMPVIAKGYVDGKRIPDDEYAIVEAEMVALANEMIIKAKQIDMLEAERRDKIWGVLRTGITPVEHFSQVGNNDAPKHYYVARYDKVLETVASFVDAESLTSDGIYPSDVLDVVWKRTDNKRGYVKNGYWVFLPDYHRHTDRLVAHELGHVIEMSSDHALDAAYKFLIDRTGLNNLSSLAEDFPDQGYEPDEKYFPDRFITPYVGKQYVSRHKVVATEVISVGLENYIYDPAMFARLDPEHFDLIWNVLHHRPSGDSTKTGHWERVLRDEQGQWRDTPGMGDDVPSELPEGHPEGGEAPTWINDGVGRSGDFSKFDSVAQSVETASLYKPEYDAVPDLEKLKAGEWKDITGNSMSIGVWKVTDSDGNKWFAKYIGGSNMLPEIAMQPINERDAGYLGRALGLNLVPAEIIPLEEVSGIVPRWVGMGKGEDVVVSPWVEIMTGLEMGKDLRAEWRMKKIPLDTKIKAALFDAVIQNSDRHAGNYGAGSDGSLVLIDNGFSFAEHPSIVRTPWLKEVEDNTIIDRSYLLWMRQGIEDSAKYMTPEHEKYVKERYTEIKDWWEEKSAGERGYITVGQLKSSQIVIDSTFTKFVR